MAPGSLRIGLEDLMRRTNNVYVACGGGQDENSQEEDEGLDQFARLKKSIAQQLIKLRKNIAERDDLTQQEERKKTIKLSQQIRKDIQQVKEDEKALAIILKKLTQKRHLLQRKRTKEEEDANIKRQEQLELIRQHIKEVEALDRRRFTQQVSENADGRTGMSSESRNQLFRGVKEIAAKDPNLPDNPLQSALPEIDISDSLQKIRAKDKEIDEGLDVISSAVSRLHNIALEQQNELKTQAVLLDEIENKVDKTTEHLETLNGKLKTTLKKAGGAEKFIIVIVLLIIILIAMGVLYIAAKTVFAAYIPTISI